MSIRHIKIDTENTSLVFAEADGNIEIKHYGKNVTDSAFYNVENIEPYQYVFGASSDQKITQNAPYSSLGDGNNVEHASIICNADGTYVNRFVYVGHETVQGGAEAENLPCAHAAKQTVIITLSDKHAGVELKQYYTTFSDSDVIAVRQTLTNKSNKTISVKRLFSLQLDISGTGHKCVSFHGAWSRERFRKETQVSAGTFVVQSMSGSTSAMSNPFIMVERKKNDGIYAFNLLYSGNHKEVVEAHTDLSNTRILVGMNDYGFDWTLKSGETFETPQAIMLFEGSEREITAQMHKFVMNHIIDPNFVNKERPVLFNNWEGTGMKFNEEKLLALAEVASSVGIELFVLDDGWFGHRDNDSSSLGDWYDAEKKLGGTLGDLADKIRAKGLKFGIWVEPEMISEDSDLFRAHPEYAMAVPNREPIRRRHQLMLDLVNPDVRDYVVESISDVILRCNAYYVKWDFNRYMSDMYSPVLANQGEYFHRYVLALYSILKELKKRFPNVLFESCASGGSRFDLGMLKYMPQTWGSDNTDAVHRLYIQEGTLVAYPQSTIGAHVAKWTNVHYESKFNVACIGAFGYELDATDWSQEEFEIIKAQISYYKQHRRLLQFGNFTQLESIFEEDRKSSWIVMSEDKSEAIAFICERNELCNSAPSKWRLSGFDDNAVYSVEIRKQANVKEIEAVKELKGDVLNNCELSFGRLFTNEIAGKFVGVLASRLIYFKKIK